MLLTKALSCNPRITVEGVLLIHDDSEVYFIQEPRNFSAKKRDALWYSFLGVHGNDVKGIFRHL